MRRLPSTSDGQRNVERPLRSLPSGTRPTTLIRGTFAPSRVRLPVTRTTKIPIEVLRSGEVVLGLSVVVVVELCSRLRHVASQVICGVLVRGSGASESPPHASW